MAYVMADFAKPISSPGLSLGDVLPTLPEDQLSLYLDLGPYANPSPYVVQEDASLSKVGLPDWVRIPSSCR
jgi:chloride channel 7